MTKRVTVFLLKGAFMASSMTAALCWVGLMWLDPDEYTDDEI